MTDVTDLKFGPGLTIDHCEWRIATFVNRDAYVGYDRAGTPDDPHTTITQLANGAHRAFSSSHTSVLPCASLHGSFI
jgi:hypothetical protein